MGKITSLIEFHGSVGNLTGYRGRDGRNVIRQKIYDPRNAKTPLQMRRRVAWGNLVNLWALIMNFMKPSFTNKAKGQTDYNAFMKANVDANPVYMTKKEVAKGGVIVSPVVVTSGVLPAIGASLVNGGKIQSSLALGDLELSSETTVGAFSHAILENNEGWQNGDQLSALLVQQLVYDEAAGASRAKASFASVILDETSYTLLYDVVSDACFSASQGFLSTKSAVNGGVAWIQSRKVDGETQVSSQSLTVNNNVLSEYTSKAAQDKAIASYGGQNVAPLTPTGNQYQPNENAMP